jgi:parvulin-like peptidyl-prolyl isomerase
MLRLLLSSLACLLLMFALPLGGQQPKPPAPTSPAPPAPSSAPPPAAQAPRPMNPQQREEEEDEEAERRIPSDAKRAPLPSLAEVPRNTPVLTLKNLCTAAPKAAPGGAKPPCVTQVTRGRFDELVEAINPEMSEQSRAQVAQGYARLLVMAAAAHKRHLDSDPKVRTLLELARLQALAQELNKRMLREAGNVPPQQIQQYYDQHQQLFLEATLERIFVPKLSGEKQLDGAKQKALAEKLRAAAAGGADFATLQKQAYTESDLKQAAPPANMGVRRAGSLAPTQNEVVFGMLPGQISEVLEDPSGFYIYKMDTRTILPLSNAEQEIRQRVARENYQNEMRAIFGAVTPSADPKYFGDVNMSWNLPPAAGQNTPRTTPAPPPSSAPAQKPK